MLLSMFQLRILKFSLFLILISLILIFVIYFTNISPFIDIIFAASTFIYKLRESLMEGDIEDLNIDKPRGSISEHPEVVSEYE
jgi:hypothetical protein